MKRFKDITEGTFSIKDVMGYETFIVTDGKEMYSENGEVQKLPKETDLWINKRNKYSNFCMDKKVAKKLAKDIGGVKVKKIKVREPISESKDFYRLPSRIIKNEFYVLNNVIRDAYGSVKSGNDYNPKMLMEAEELIKKIKKSVVKNPSEEEMAKLDH